MIRFSMAMTAMVLGLAAAAAPAPTPPTPTPVVDTRSGPVQGVIEAGVASFKGIPYAAPPVGERRFKPPAPVTPWTDILDATGYGAPCVQMYDGKLTGSTLSLQLATIFTMESEMKIDNEDCLYLNLWTPGADHGKRPVMVWLHGGGFAYGSGAWPVYNGAGLAHKGDVVVITVNHRLNVFGYLSLAGYGAEYAQSGNAGMLDLVAALHWVRDNAATFGGDPGNVTIMGESGGGAKVSTLMAMPRARGLFHRAIVQSGPGLTAVPGERAAAVADAVAGELGATPEQPDALTQAHTGEIMAAVAAANAHADGAGPFGLPLAPVVDGDVVPRHPFTPDAPPESRDVPLLIGWNKDEMSIFNASRPWFGNLTEEGLQTRAAALAGDAAGELIAAYTELRPGYTPTYVLNAIMGDMYMMAGSILQSERKVAQGGAPVYMYRLVWNTPVGGGILKSPHTLDIPLMFNNVDRGVALTGDSASARLLANEMSSAWIAFARRGNPDNTAIPAWPPYDVTNRPVMVFDTETRVVNDPDARLRQALTR